mmetsp:Transcript_23212/g.30046  ORF Transcript_23212/g.30046 Transcript_23212/m.30046 type:complete len:325 (-) Transcript_23212:2252-3226(-)
MKHNSGRLDKKRGKKNVRVLKISVRLILILFIGLSFGIILVRMILQSKATKLSMNNEKQSSNNLRHEDKLRTNVSRIIKDDKNFPLLENEQRFRQTLRSCLGEACLTASPIDRPRIALLSPPHPIASKVWKVLLRTLKDKSFAEFIIGSNAIPYGYGKSHGLTRIVRLVLPLRLEKATFALAQSVRWHCRISHVAAHTALLTLDLSDNIPPRRLIEQALSFIGLKVDHSILDRAVRDWNTTIIPSLERAIQSSSTVNARALDAQLQGELDISNDLRKWPCGTLWVKKDDERALNRAAQMVPNCSAPYSTCSVPRDKCEFNGGGC